MHEMVHIRESLCCWLCESLERNAQASKLALDSSLPRWRTSHQSTAGTAPTSRSRATPAAEAVRPATASPPARHCCQ